MPRLYYKAKWNNWQTFIFISWSFSQVTWVHIGVLLAITRHVQGYIKAKLNTFSTLVIIYPKYELERWDVVMSDISVIIICSGCDFQPLLFVSGVPETSVGSRTQTFSFLLKNEVRELSVLHCGRVQGQLHLISINPQREEKQGVSSHSSNEIYPLNERKWSPINWHCLLARV